MRAPRAGLAVAVVLFVAVSAASAAALKSPMCAVPNVVGKTLMQTRTALQNAHCTVGTIHIPTGVNGRPTVVSLESPKASRKMKAGTRVDLWLKVKPVSPVSIGQTQTVYDLNGHPMSVTVTSVADPATPSDSFEQPDPGKRFIAVNLQLTSASSGTVSDDANSDTAVVGSDDQTYTADFDTVAGCTNFDYGSYTIAPGDTLDGCVVFQLPLGVTAKQVQFSLYNGVVDFNS